MAFRYLSLAHLKAYIFALTVGKRVPVIALVMASIIPYIAYQWCGKVGLCLSVSLVAIIAGYTAFDAFFMKSSFPCLYIRMFRHDKRFEPLQILITLFVQEIKISYRSIFHTTINMQDLYKYLLAAKVIEETETYHQEATSWTLEEIEELRAKYESNIEFFRDKEKLDFRFLMTEPVEWVPSSYLTVEISNLIIVGTSRVMNFEILIEEPNVRTAYTYIPHITNHARFNKCTFVPSDRGRKEDETRWMIQKDQRSLLEFSNCSFAGISPEIKQLTSFTDYSDLEYSISISNVIFLAQNLTDFLLYFEVNRNHIKLAPPSIEYSDADVTKIKIESSYFSKLNIQGVTHLQLNGSNVIQEFYLRIGKEKYAPMKDEENPLPDSDVFHLKMPLEDILIPSARRSREIGLLDKTGSLMAKITPSIIWGGYQRIKAAKAYPEQYPGIRKRSDWLRHREMLFELKKIASQSDNVTQNLIISREIMICDHELLAFDRWWSTYQDRISLGFSKWVSNYGISWMRPFALLAFSNLTYAGAISFIHGSDILALPTLKIAIEAFNPIAEFESHLNNQSLINELIIIALSLMQKGVLALMVYEIIRSARRFTRVSV